MQALAERLDGALGGRVLERYEPLGFTGLKTADPPADDLIGRTLVGVGRRGKYDVMDFGDGLRVAFHLSQGGRLDLERPPKATKPAGLGRPLGLHRPRRRRRRVAERRRQPGRPAVPRARQPAQGRLVGPRSR